MLKIYVNYIESKHTHIYIVYYIIRILCFTEIICIYIYYVYNFLYLVYISSFLSRPSVLPSSSPTPRLRAAEAAEVPERMVPWVAHFSDKHIYIYIFKYVYIYIYIYIYI